MSADEQDREDTTEVIPVGPPPDPDSPSERFFGGAVPRILRGILLFGLLGTAISAALDLKFALGFLIGSALAYENFRSLSRAVNSLGERVVLGHSRESGGRIVFRFIARILLVALAGYAIFISSPKSLPGYLAGLCIPVAAMLWEAGFEAFAALRRGL